MKIVTKILMTFLLTVIFVSANKSQQNESKKFWIDVTVTNKDGSYASDLKAENFEVMVNDKLQKITDFTKNDEIASVMFLIDLSGSVQDNNKIKTYTEGIKNFIETANQNNEYSIAVFNTESHIILDKTQNTRSVQDTLQKVAELIPKGNTAFYDSLYATAERLAAESKYRKKVLIVCTDGEDNVSKTHTIKDVKKILRINSILLYSVNLSKKGLNSISGMAFLDDLTFVSGGKSFYPSKNLDIFNSIAKEISSQYLIGFENVGGSNSEEFEDLKIKIKLKDKTKLMARAKSKLYLPKAK